MTREELIKLMATAVDVLAFASSRPLYSMEAQAAALTAIEQAGLVIVPISSTPEMAIKGGIAWCKKEDELAAVYGANSGEFSPVDMAHACYTAMIEASPFVEKKDAD